MQEKTNYSHELKAPRTSLPKSLIELKEILPYQNSGLSLIDRIDLIHLTYGASYDFNYQPQAAALPEPPVATFPSVSKLTYGDKLLKPPLPLAAKAAPVIPKERQRFVQLVPYSNLFAEIRRVSGLHGVKDGGYQEGRDKLLKAAVSEENPYVRKKIAGLVAKLAIDANDPNIVKGLETVVKRMARQKKKLNIGPEEELALRVFTSLGTPDANNALLQMLIADKVDPRIKKFILASLMNRNNFLFRNSTKIGRSVMELMKRDSRRIRWDDFRPLTAISAIPNRVLRERATALSQQTFANLLANSVYEDSEGISELHEKISPNTPPEAFLQIYELSRISGIDLKTIDKLYQTAKGNQRLTDDLTSIFTQALNYSADSTPPGINTNEAEESGLVIKILLAKPVSTLELPVFIHAANKVLFLLKQMKKSGDRSNRHTLYENLITQMLNTKRFIGKPLSSLEKEHPRDYFPNFEVFSKKVSGLIAKGKTIDLAEIDKALTATVVDAFNKVIVGEDFKFDQQVLINLVNIWGDIDPIYLYFSSLYKHDSKRHTLKLFAEMINHMDPPHFTKWKTWRYNLENGLVNDQIGFLSESARLGYSNDYLTEFTEVLQGTDMEVKPQRIKELILHMFTSGEGNSQPELKAKRWLRNFLEDALINPETFTRKLERGIEDVERALSALSDISSLKRDSSMAQSAKDRLSKWRTAKFKKQQQLQQLGYTGNETQEQINTEIASLKQELPSETESKVDRLGKKGLISEYQKLLQHIGYLQAKGEAPTDLEKARLDEIQQILQSELGSDYGRSIDVYRRISQLTSSSPTQLDKDLMNYLTRYGLNADVSSDELETTYQLIQAKLAEKITSRKTLFWIAGVEPDKDFPDNELQTAIYDFKTISHLLRMCKLDTTLIAFNRLSQDPDSTRITLTDAVRSVKKYFEKDSQITAEIERIEDILGNQADTAGQSDIICVFTDNPLVGLTVGKYPKGAESCQKYTNASIELAAYPADASTKFSLLIDKSKLPEDIATKLDSATTMEEKMEIFNTNTYTFLEAMIARRITKIIRRSDTNKPAIFLEPVYTSYDKEQMTRQLNDFARQILRPKTTLQLMTGEIHTIAGIRVKVASSRNGTQYEDGATGGPDNGGMGIKSGPYEMDAELLEK